MQRKWSQHEKREVLYSPSYRATHVWNSKRETWSINWAKTVRSDGIRHSAASAPGVEIGVSLKILKSDAMPAIVFTVYRLHRSRDSMTGQQWSVLHPPSARRGRRPLEF